MVITPGQPNPEKGLVGADCLGGVVINFDRPTRRVWDRGGQYPRTVRCDLASEAIPIEADIPQGMALNCLNLLVVMVTKLNSHDPVVELVVSQLGRLELQANRKLAIVVANV